MKYLILAAAMLVGLLQNGARADAFDACKEHLPFGQPSVNGAAHVTPICHAGYAALVDDDVLAPRWVAYHLTGAHTLGCNKRQNNFHPDEQIAGHRAMASDYLHSGFDLGHNAPFDDFAWDAQEASDSFSTANMAPQIHLFNAGEWLLAEKTVRAWALQRGDLQIYVGTIVGPNPQTIGKDKIAVPSIWWKVVIDTAKQEAIAWEMPNENIPIGNFSSYLVPVSKIELDASISLPLPVGVDKNIAVTMWAADLPSLAASRKKACAH